MLLPILLMQMVSCQEKPKMKEEVVVTDISLFSNSSKNSKNRSVYVDASKKLDPNIIITKSSTVEINYKLQGFIKSSGLEINNPRNIKTEKNIINDTLVISHMVSVVGISGKEGSTVIGYNYKQDELQNIQKGIKFVKIELFEHFEKQKTKERNRTVLIAEKNIDLKMIKP